MYKQSHGIVVQSVAHLHFFQRCSVGTRDVASIKFNVRTCVTG